MATVYQMIDAISDVTGLEPSKVRQCARQMLDDYVLPRSVGRRIADISAEHLVLMLLAPLTADAVKDATRQALKYGQLSIGGSWKSDELPTDSPDQPATLSAFLALLIDMYARDPEQDGRLRNLTGSTVSICLSWYEAFVYVKGELLPFTEPGGSSIPHQGLKKTIEVPGYMLAQLAMRYAKSQSGGWVDEDLTQEASLIDPAPEPAKKPATKSKAKR